MNSQEYLSVLQQRISTTREEIHTTCEHIMSDPETSEEEFNEAFRQRDINHVDRMTDCMTDEEREDFLAELRWETGCGCNGNDSPFHTYFGF